jgi:TP901 family phage tail tape measure protein
LPKSQEIGIRISGSIDPSLNKSIFAAEQGMRRLNKGTGQVSSGFKGAGRSGTQFGASSVNAVNNLDAAIASAGIIAGLTATYSAFMECVEAADKYETAIAKVSTIADTSEKSIGAIKSELTALSNETGKSVLELSEAEYQALSASVDTAKSVDFVSQANQLAVGGFTDATSAVDVLTTTLNAYGLEADKASTISDMLITTQNKGKTTVNELASSLGTVIPTAAAYSTNMENVSTAYALLTKNGIATANTGTAVRGMLNELGDTGSDVSKTLYKLSGQTFAGLMSNGKSLGDIIEMLSKSVDGDATAFRGLWSNARAAQAALTLFNTGAEEFNTVLGDMENSSGTTAKAYATMTSTAEHAQEVFKTSAENLQIAIGDVLSPQVEELYKLGTDGLQLIEGFVKEHPEVVQALTAGAVGLGVVAAGLVIYTAGTKVATTVTNLFTAAMETNPLFMGLTIAAGVITAVALFANAMANATADANQLTAASQKQKDEIDNLNTEYDEACQKYGKTSDEAIALKLKIDDLTTEYENNKQTIGELIQKQGDLNDKYTELQESDKSSSLDEEAASASYLSNKLFSLAEQTNRTAAENQEMYSIINKLNEQFPELSLNYDDVISKTGQTKEAVQNYLKGLYDQKQYQNAQDQWTKTYGLLQKQREQLSALGKQVTAAGKEYGKSDGNAVAYSKYQAAMDKMVEYTDSSGKKVKMSLREAYQQASNNVKSMSKDLDKYENTMLGISGSTDKNAQSTKDWKSATSTALQGLQTEIDALAASYDKEYDSAYKAITGTVGLTKKLSNDTDVTASSMRENWRDQTEWINKYSSNLQKAQGYGITKGLIDSLSDGSEQSGQYINKIITQLDGMNKADAKAFVKGLNKDFKSVTKAEKGFADTVAKYKSDFDNKMDGMVAKAKTSINQMGLKGKAKQKAMETIQGYIDGINLKVNGVNKAVDAVKSAVASKLTPKNITPYQAPKVEENAKGTKHSANIFLAGEEGPELVVNAKGSQVFTAAETQRILSGDADGAEENNQTVTMFDVSELVSQLMPKKPKGGLTLSDMYNNIGASTTDNSSTYHVTYAPVIQVKSEGGHIDKGEIQKASRISQNEFDKFMRRYEKEQKRIKFKPKSK